MWPFLDGRVTARGCDLRSLEASRFINVLLNEWVEDSLFEKEVLDARDKARGQVLRAYNQMYQAGEENLYGSSNDDAGAYQHARDPLPRPTMPTDDGYPGLDPPVG